ncbi:MAG: KTSC domain-containing protein [Chitinophagaceae bacterium]|jgi:curved DNA-binding protein CbpA
MKRINESKKIFGLTQEADLAQLKTLYRGLIKEWHPDKIQDDEEKKAQAELKSKEIISAYHFLVSISPETHKANEEEYNRITSTLVIDDFEYKGSTLKIVFQDKTTYEYFGVPKNIYTKFLNSDIRSRFARRHIFSAFRYRNSGKMVEA